ncbi:hydrogenase [Wenzhouxiangella sp. XN79A]|uniref:hydrogenase n=1 Tax=Wenzhouxiangella sp. XN79A TaxID=2724193 RepID=UPI00144AF9D0|nr:hydrogenase [Wenzhouxiangella sp. XN79A]NKI34700.1 hydrogenase [Wenzhouxiangella sp. XN79A]
MQKRLAAHGFVLALLGLLTGLIGPDLPLPRLGLAAHTIGLLGAALLLGLAACWPLFDLTDRARRWMAGLWLIALYTNWAGCLLGAALGAGRLTPLAARGAEGPAWAEAAVAVLLGGGSLAAFAAVILGLVGLRR